MALSTELFVMFIFVVGFPFYYSLLMDPQLEGGRWFLAAYGCLMLSNIFTVVEEFWLNYLFNFLEHLFIMLGSLMFIAAIVRLTSKPDSGPDSLPGDRNPEG